MSGWYSHFYEDDAFKNEMIRSYREALPYLQWLCEEGIDIYVDYISASLKMDHIIMSTFPPNETSCYGEYDNYIRYLKFFIASRVNFLNDLWEIESNDIDIDQLAEDNECHLVRFWIGDECVSQSMVCDGEMIDQFPVCNLDMEYAWRKDGKGKRYNKYIPIYESVDLYMITEE